MGRNQPIFEVCKAWQCNGLAIGVAQLIQAMARKTHPDLGSDPERFRLVTEAYLQAQAAMWEETEYAN